jgi:hypothetical protein
MFPSHLNSGFSPQGNILWQDGKYEMMINLSIFLSRLQIQAYLKYLYIYVLSREHFLLLFFFFEQNEFFFLFVGGIFILEKILKISSTSFRPLFSEKIDSLLFLSSLEDKSESKKKT